MLHLSDRFPFGRRAQRTCWTRFAGVFFRRWVCQRLTPTPLASPVVARADAEHFRKVHLQSLVEKSGMVVFPTGQGRIEGIQNLLHLLGVGDPKSTAILPVQLKYPPRGRSHLAHLAASVHPELPAIMQGLFGFPKRIFALGTVRRRIVVVNLIACVLLMTGGMVRRGSACRLDACPVLLSKPVRTHHKLRASRSCSYSHSYSQYRHDPSCFSRFTALRPACGGALDHSADSPTWYAATPPPLTGLRQPGGYNPAARSFLRRTHAKPVQ